MAAAKESTLYIALIHHPVLNKNREVIGSAVTNLDIHDIARTARTYGVARYFIATPYREQHQLLEELLDHWHKGHGAQANPARWEALRLVVLVDSLGQAIEKLHREHDALVRVIATSARGGGKTIGYPEVRRLLDEKQPVLLLFGTAHGLAPEIIEAAHGVLPPLQGSGTYNHLSVRSAASITIDRLLGS